MTSHRSDSDIAHTNDAFFIKATDSLFKIDWEDCQTHPSKETNCHANRNGVESSLFSPMSRTCGNSVQQSHEDTQSSSFYVHQPTTSKNSIHKEMDMICTSTNETKKEQSTYCARSVGCFHGKNGTQILSSFNNNEIEDMTSSLANKLQKDEFAIAFSCKNDLEDENLRNSHHNYESSHSHMTHLEELIFPPFADKDNQYESPDWSMGCKTNLHEITKETTCRDSPSQLKDGISYEVPNVCQKKIQKSGLRKISSTREYEHCAALHSGQENTGTRDARKYLGAEFMPSSWDVVFGRGKESYHHIGNRRLKIIVAMNLRKYSDSRSQLEKFQVVDGVVRQIREASPNKAGFVEKDKDGNWYIIDTLVVKQKVARTFRDSMIGLLRCNARLNSEGRNKNVIKAQNTIFRSCQIQFSG